MGYMKYIQRLIDDKGLTYQEAIKVIEPKRKRSKKNKLQLNSPLGVTK